MKTFMVYVDKVDWDEFDAAIVLADSEEEVRSMFQREDENYAEYAATVLDGPECHMRFYDHQGEIHIKEITEKGLALASFNAG